MTEAIPTQAVRLSIEIAAKPRRLFEALTRNDRLQAWFCESSAISTEAKRYDFWGRYTPENPSREGGHHPLIAWTDDRSITFEWTLRGGPTRVEFSLEPSGSGTKLSVAHTGLRPRARQEGALTDWWGHCFENLKSWMEKNSIAPRRDFTARAAQPFQIAVDIDAPREAVFRALIEPNEMERYIAEVGKAIVEARVGGRYDFGWGDEGGPVKIVAFEPNAKLSYSWVYDPEPESLVTWALEGSGNKSRLTLTHAGITDDSLFEGYATGWGKFLNRVKHMVEGGPTWKRSAATKVDF